MTTPREEFFQVWAASDPWSVALPAASFLLCLMVFVGAVYVSGRQGRGESERLANLPLDDDGGAR